MSSSVNLVLSSLVQLDYLDSDSQGSINLHPLPLSLSVQVARVEQNLRAFLAPQSSTLLMNPRQWSQATFTFGVGLVSSMT